MIGSSARFTLLCHVLNSRHFILIVPLAKKWSTSQSGEEAEHNRKVLGHNGKGVKHDNCYLVSEFYGEELPIRRGRKARRPVGFDDNMTQKQHGL